MGHRNRRAVGRLSVLVFAVMALGLLSAPGAFAATQDIASPGGPLTNIWLGSDFRCQVEHSGESLYQFFPSGSQAGNCGTWLSLNSPAGGSPTLYGPFLTSNQFTNPTQSGVSGDGTPGNPYTVTTTGDAVSSADVGTTTVHVSQVDSYVGCATRSSTGDCVGNEYYRTDITLTNNSPIAASGRLYHAADCYLQGSDSGYGYVDAASNAVACAQHPNNDPPALIEEFAPVTSGAHYLETGYSSVYGAVTSQGDLPDRCDCTISQDNGMAINWAFSLAAGQSTTFSMFSNFSPQGVVAPNHTLTVHGDRTFSGSAPLNVDNGTVATFTDSVPNTTPSQYSATIDWGDNSEASAGTIASDGNGGFSVTGSHTYQNPGTYSITVTVRVNGNSSQGSATDTASVTGTHQISATGGRSFSGNAPYSLDDTVASFTDSKPGTSASDYTATIDWGDKSSQSEGGIKPSGNGFIVTGTHTYNDAATYTITVTINAIDGQTNSPSVTDTATVNPANNPASNPGPTTSPPTAVTSPTATSQSTQAQLTGTVNPGGLDTTVHWRYGLDQAYRGPGFSGDIYDQSTPDQPAGSGTSDESVSAVVSGLQPNAVYHYRLVATNSKGTTVGQDRTFKTASDGPPSTPVVGQNGNFAPAGGNVFVLINGQFVKLTEVRQLPNGTVVDALHGSIKLTVASGRRNKTYTGTFGGAVFKVTQARKGANRGLTTLSLVEGAFKGGPSYASCKAKKKAPRAVSSRILQTLHSRATGRFRTRGRYAAGTVRGTRWTTSDRCDGTLISVQLHSVVVNDFVRHISVLVRAGHSYFASATAPRVVKPPRPTPPGPPFTG